MGCAKGVGLWRGCLVHWKLECGERFFSVLEVGVLIVERLFGVLEVGVWGVERVWSFRSWNVGCGGVSWLFSILEVGVWGLGCG